MGGQEALLTARGQTWDEFAVNVARLQGLLDAAPLLPPPQSMTRRCAARMAWA
jgi:hypothetical protein